MQKSEIGLFFVTIRPYNVGEDGRTETRLIVAGSPAGAKAWGDSESVSMSRLRGSRWELLSVDPVLEVPVARLGGGRARIVCELIQEDPK